MPDATAPLARLAEVARRPRGYIERWRSAHPGQPVVGVLPMNFPREIAHAAGTLPVVVQDDQQPVTESLAASIRAHNRDRRLIRQLFDERSSGSATFTPRQLQDIVGSSMVMDPAEHHTLLAEAVTAAREAPRDDRIRVHLSAHLCHAPRRELLDLIEDSGAMVVDDDLFHGRRYVSTDVDETGDPIDAIARWYARRNVTIPCPTRVQQDADWDAYLVAAVHRSGAEAVIHLLPKFCEPHLLYYPELRKGLDAAGIPQLLLETEHEGLPAESFRTRVEALVERARRKRPVPA